MFKVQIQNATFNEKVHGTRTVLCQVLDNWYLRLNIGGFKLS